MNDPEKKKTTSAREINNARLFADEIVFSGNEPVLFEEDLQEQTEGLKALMDGNPAERYTAIRKLNAGGMKTIWEVSDRRTARKLAMALIQPDRIASATEIDTFLYEARLTANLQHPNIIPIYDIALDENGNPYFTMKALKGRTLDELLRKIHRNERAAADEFPLARLLDIFLKVCDAIEYAHSKGVIHLDLKPANIIIGDYGDVQVLDWGLSTLVTQFTDGEPTEETHPGAPTPRAVVGGTPGYMAPEQVRGSLEEIDFRTDIYMLGAILYEIMTGHCPIEGADAQAVLEKTVAGAVRPPAEHDSPRKISTALSAVAMKAMATDPGGRYPSVAPLIQDIRNYIDGFAVSAENPTFFTHAALLVKRHRLAVSLLATGVMILTLVIAQSYFSIRRSEGVTRQALATLQEKNDYIAAVARQVAPNYLDLAQREAEEYAFDAAEQALDTSLAFDPSQGDAWLEKAHILLAQLRFEEAETILTGGHGHPIKKDAEALTLAHKYRGYKTVNDHDLPGLVAAFQQQGMTDALPRLFYHLNQATFDPSSRFAALETTLQQLNPNATAPAFKWSASADGGWNIQIKNSPQLNHLTPLCGLDLRSLHLENIGEPDLRIVTEATLKELSLADSQIARLPSLPTLVEIETLNLSGTRIRNLEGIVRFPKLRTLDLGGIKNLVLPQSLIWCRELTLLTVDESLTNDPTLQALGSRDVLIIYTPNE